VISVSFKSRFNARDLVKQVDKILDQAKNRTFHTARSHTPVRSGYAKSQWRRSDTASGYKVSNRVEYMPFLEAGRSRQAPRGIVKPTVKKVTGFIRTRSLKR